MKKGSGQIILSRLHPAKKLIQPHLIYLTQSSWGSNWKKKYLFNLENYPQKKEMNCVEIFSRHLFDLKSTTYFYRNKFNSQRSLVKIELHRDFKTFLANVEFNMSVVPSNFWAFVQYKKDLSKVLGLMRMINDSNLVRSIESFCWNKKHLNTFFKSKQLPFYKRGIKKVPNLWKNLINEDGWYFFTKFRFILKKNDI